MITFRIFRGYSAVLLIALALGWLPIAFNFVVDPYRMHALFDLGLEKQKIALKKHGQLFKAIEYPRNKSAYLVLGDSRSRALRDKLFHEIGFKDFYNFAYSGGTLPEMVDTFWYAVEHGDVKGVVLGLPLRMMDTKYYDDKNLMPEAIKMAGQPVTYYRSMFVAKTGVEVVEKTYPETVDRVGTVLGSAFNPISSAQAADMPVYTYKLGQCVSKCRDRTYGTQTSQPLSLIPSTTGFSGAVDVLTNPKVSENTNPLLKNMATDLLRMQKIGSEANLDGGITSRDSSLERYQHNAVASNSIEQITSAKWKRQIEKAGRNDWNDFNYSEEYFQRIVEILEYSKENDIKVVLFIPPTHTDMQQRAIDFEMLRMNTAHKKRLATLAPVLDFDFPNSITRDRANFSDGYHFKANVAKDIAFEFVRFFGASSETLKLIEKRRIHLTCPLTADDVVVSKMFGNPPVYVGTGCARWGQLS